MEISRIVVTDLIMIGNLSLEEGYDQERSADNLADVKGQVIMGYLQEHYPDVESYADIAIQKEAGGKRSLEVLAYTEEGEVIPAKSADLQKKISERIEEAIAGNSWAVKLA